jgi:hypothetical protein
MTKKLTLIALCALPAIVFSQSLGLQLGIGTSHFLGDLGGKPTYGTNDPSDLDLSTTRYVASAGLRLNLAVHFPCVL